MSNQTPEELEFLKDHEFSAPCDISSEDMPCDKVAKYALVISEGDMSHTGLLCETCSSRIRNRAVMMANPFVTFKWVEL